MVVSQSFISSSICAQITSAYYILLWVIKMLINKSALPQFQERSTLLNESPFWYVSRNKHNTSTETHTNSLLLKSTVSTLHCQSPCTCFALLISFWFPNLLSLHPPTYSRGKITVPWLRYSMELPPLSDSCTSPTCHTPPTFFSAHIKPLISAFLLWSPDLFFLFWCFLFPSDSSLWSCPNLSSLQNTSIHLVFQ